MTDVKVAKIKLEKAINRLETAVDSISRGQSRGDRVKVVSAEKEVFKSNMVTLRAEKGELAERLASVSADYEALEKVVDEVSARLDATIGKLRGILDT